MLAENEIISKVLVALNTYKDLGRMKAAVADGEYSPITSPQSFSRTLVWKASLITNSLTILQWGASLSQSRAVFHEITKREDMAIPWHSLDETCCFFREKSLRRQISVHRIETESRASSERERSGPHVDMGNVKDPSPSLGHTTAYAFTESDTDLLKSIILDIDRLFPGEAFFLATNPKLRASKNRIIEVLYVWCKCNPLVGYKQGIHEIIGLISMELEQEAVSISHSSEFSPQDLQILGLYDTAYMAHDLFTVFNRFMVLSGIIALFYESESVLWSSIERFNIYLMKVDQLIHYNLVNKLKLESQLWAIRYFRLLLSRELDSNLELVALLWDKLVILDHGEHGLIAIPEMLMFMTIQLLIQVKTELVACDFSDCLSLLLHYPMQTRLKAHSSALLMMNHLFRDASKLYAARNDDKQLYERGLKLNVRYNPSLKIKMNFDNRPSSSSRPSSPPKLTPADKMSFEKYHTEQRLKKKLQLMVKH